MKIAAIIATYNSSGTIEETIKSILSQTRKCDEIIVVDDGSIDNTKEIVEKYKEVKYIYKQNSGVSDSRNIGVANTNCDWIALCDSDDIWYPNKIQIFENVMNNTKNKCKFYFHAFDLFGSKLAQNGGYTSYGQKSVFAIFKENKISIFDVFEGKEDVSAKSVDSDNRNISVYYGNIFKWLILGNFILPSSIIVEKKFFNKMNGFDHEFKVAEETEFFLRCSKNTKFGFVDKSLTNYRWLRAGLTKDLSTLLTYGMKALLKNTLNDQNFDTQYRKCAYLAISRRYGRASYYSLTVMDKKAALKNALLSLKYKTIQSKAYFVIILSLIPSKVLSALSEIKGKLNKY